PYIDIRAIEYSGLDQSNPFDAGTSSSGTSNSANSGAVTTTAAHELIFGAGITVGGFGGAGANFTTRIITTPDADIAEDRFVTTEAAYSATALLTGSAAWVMQVATFKAADNLTGGGQLSALTVSSAGTTFTPPGIATGGPRDPLQVARGGLQANQAQILV